MHKSICSLFIAALSMPFSSQAQNLWSLDRCLEHAIENNIELKQQHLAIDIAEAELNQSRMELFPSLGLGASQTFRFGRSVDPLTYEFTTDNTQGSSFYGSSSLDVFNGFRNINSIKKNRLNLEMVITDFESAKYDLSLNITRLYLQILFNKELVDIIRQQIQTTALQENTTRKLVNAGSLAKGDLLEIQAQRSVEESDLVSAVNQLRLSLLSLAQLLELENIENFDIEQPSFENELITNLGLTYGEVYESAINTLPGLKSAAFRIQMQEKDLDMARGLISPSITLNASWGTGYSDQIMDFESNNIMPFWNQVDYASTTSFGLRLNIPVFNNWSYRATIKKKEIELLNSQFELDLVKSNLRKEIQKAIADATAALENYRAMKKTLEYLDEAFSFTEKKYSLGMLRTTDYNIAKDKISKAQSELLKAKYSYIFNSRILDFYLGIPVNLN
jgi:outer membrane protein